MDPTFLIYLRAAGSFWFNLSQPQSENVELVKLSSEQQPEHGIHEYSYESLLAFGIRPSVESAHKVFFDGKLIVVAPIQKQWLRRAHVEESDFLIWVGNAAAAKYRESTKSQLLTSLSQLPDCNSIDAILVAFCRYTAYDSYSAWAYNPITDVFTRIAGSTKTATDFVHKEKSTLLCKAISGSSTICGRVADLGGIPDINTTSDLLTASTKDSYVNAFCVSPPSTQDILCEMGVTTIKVVVCMYTNHDGYDLREDTKSLIKTFLQRDLANRYFNRFLRMSKVSVDTSDTFDFDKPNESLQLLADRVCKILQWETCVILLASNEDTTRLVLRAIAPLNRKSDKFLNQSYSIVSRSMTAEVFRSGSPLWSYDISTDVRNTHTIDDPTVSKPKNWLAVPIKTHLQKPIGVIRVKNRIPAPGTTDRQFSSLDLLSLDIVAAQIGHFLERCETYAERRKLANEREREVRELRDFLRTFRHEIRSPIQAICFAPERLVRILVGEKLVFPNSIPKRLVEYLSDFKATGNRLEMISTALTLEPEELVRDIVMHNLFKDCIAPVLAFAETLAIKKGRLVYVNKDSLFVNMKCDCLAMSIAFHVLLDNAIKYSDKGTTIRVHGQNVPGGHAVIVENETSVFNIAEDEINEIVKKYHRGKMSAQQKMEGSGIGLFLAKRIMELHGGELRLLNRLSPIRFALFVKN